MKKKDWIFHIEFAIILIIICSIFVTEYTRDIPVNVDIDYSSLHNTNIQLKSGINKLISLHDMYEMNLEDLRSLSTCEGLDRLSSDEAIVGRVFYIEGEPFYYYLSLEEYVEAEDDVLLNSASKVNKSYIRPLTPDIKFLARQFVERYEDKTDRAIAILSLIQNIGYDENDDYWVKHPTVTLMKGGVCIDLVIACGALLKAADIDCAILIFKDQRHATIGISGIEFEKFKKNITANSIIKYGDQEYLICETTSLRHPAGNELKGALGPISAETVTMIIPYEFP
jgi:hypothetical protein